MAAIYLVLSDNIAIILDGTIVLVAEDAASGRFVVTTQSYGQLLMGRHVHRDAGSTPYSDAIEWCIECCARHKRGKSSAQGGE